MDSSVIPINLRAKDPDSLWSSAFPHLLHRMLSNNWAKIQNPEEGTEVEVEARIGHIDDSTGLFEAGVKEVWFNNVSRLFKDRFSPPVMHEVKESRLSYDLTYKSHSKSEGSHGDVRVTAEEDAPGSGVFVVTQIIRKQKVPEGSVTFGFNRGPVWKNMDRNMYASIRTGIRVTVSVEARLDGSSEYDTFKARAEAFLSAKGECDKSLQPMSVRQKIRTSYRNYHDVERKRIVRKSFDITRSKRVDGGSFSYLDKVESKYELELEMGPPKYGVLDEMTSLVRDLFAYYGYYEKDNRDAEEMRMILQCPSKNQFNPQFVKEKKQKQISNVRVKGPCRLDINAMMDMEYLKSTDRLVEYLAAKDYWLDQELLDKFSWCVSLPSVYINVKEEMTELHDASIDGDGSSQVRLSCYPGVLNFKGEEHYYSAWKYHILCHVSSLTPIDKK